MREPRTALRSRVDRVNRAPAKATPLPTPSIPATRRTPGASEHEAVVRSVSVVTLAKVLLLVTALGRSVAIAATFGSGMLTDAFFIAFFFPETIHSRLMGPLVGALVPVLVGCLARDERETARRLLWTVTHWVMIICAVCATVGYFATRQLVGLTAPGFDAATQRLAVELVWFLLPMVFFWTLATLVQSVLSAHKNFTVSALSPVLFNLVIIAAIFTLGVKLGIQGLAIGFVGGALVQFAVQIPAFRRLGLAHGMFFSPWHPALRNVAWLMFPIFLDTMTGLGVRFVENNLASQLATGSVSALGFALRLYMVPVGVFAAGLATVLLPYLSEHHAMDDRDSFRETTGFGIRSLTLVCLPITVVFLVLGPEIVSTFYLHGVFDDASAETTAGVFRLLAIGLTFQAMSLYFCKVLYALKSTLLIFWVSLATAAFNIGFDLLLVPTIGIAAIALGASLTWAAYAGSLGFILARRRQAFDAAALWPFLRRISIAVGAMTAVVFVLDRLLDGWGVFERAVVAGGVGGAVFVGACLVLRVRELVDLLGIVRKRLRRAGGER